MLPRVLAVLFGFAVLAAAPPSADLGGLDTGGNMIDIAVRA
jgi:hypothetical protein